MKNLFSAILIICVTSTSFAQRGMKVKTVLASEEEFGNYVKREGINKGFIRVSGDDALIFKPGPVSAKEYYTSKPADPGKLTWKAAFARISRNGDLAFTTGPYEYTDANGEKQTGDYLSIWKEDAGKKLKLFMDVGIAHSPTDKPVIQDFRDPVGAPLKFDTTDPFSGKSMILANDKTYNSALAINVPAAFKEFYSAQGRLLFPTYAPISGEADLNFFLRKNNIVVKGEPISAGRAASNDLAYSYGKATVRYNKEVQNFYYVRVWEIDEKHRWNVIAEVYTPETEFRLNSGDDNAQITTGTDSISTAEKPTGPVKEKKTRKKKKSDND